MTDRAFTSDDARKLRTFFVNDAINKLISDGDRPTIFAWCIYCGRVYEYAARTDWAECPDCKERFCAHCRPDRVSVNVSDFHADPD